MNEFDRTAKFLAPSLPRIVSLVPSITETLCSWGMPPVGCTRFCDLANVTVVGGTKDPSIEQIISLQPDLVILDTEENRMEDFAVLSENRLAIEVTAVRSLDDLDRALSSLAARLNRQWQSPSYGSSLPSRMNAFVPIWRRPWMALGESTYGASVLSHLGISVIPRAAGRYPQVDLDEVRALHPDVVLAPSEPYPFTIRQKAELESVGPTVFVDGRDLFWWGTRTPAALERLKEVIGGIEPLSEPR